MQFTFQSFPPHLQVFIAISHCSGSRAATPLTVNPDWAPLIIYTLLWGSSSFGCVDLSTLPVPTLHRQGECWGGPTRSVCSGPWWYLGQSCHQLSPIIIVNWVSSPAVPWPIYSAACSKEKVQFLCFQALQSSWPTLVSLRSIPQSWPGKVQGALSELLRLGSQLLRLHALICLHALRGGSSAGPGKIQISFYWAALVGCRNYSSVCYSWWGWELVLSF